MTPRTTIATTSFRSLSGADAWSSNSPRCLNVGKKVTLPEKIISWSICDNSYPRPQPGCEQSHNNEKLFLLSVVRKYHSMEGCVGYTVGKIIDIEISVNFWFRVILAPTTDTGDFEPVHFLWKLANDPRGPISSAQRWPHVPVVKDTVYSFRRPDARV